MEPKEIEVGSLYTTDYVISAYYIVDTNDGYAVHETCDICPGDMFMILSINETEETQATDVEILYDNQKMWFTFHSKEFMIEDVRRAASYDIPFVVLNEIEPGSNSTP